MSNKGNVCCMFKCKDANQAYKLAKKNLCFVENYGSSCNGRCIHTSDTGERWLGKCKECGSYVLVQESEVWINDHYYIDYFPVIDSNHAKKLNAKYDGYQIEDLYPYRKLFVTNGEPLFRDFYLKY